MNSLLQKTGVQVNDNEPIVMYAHEYMTQVSNMVEEMLANASTKRSELYWVVRHHFDEQTIINGIHVYKFEFEEYCIPYLKKVE